MRRVRWRRAGKWTATAISLLTFLVWFVSGWWGMNLSWPTGNGTTWLTIVRGAFSGFARNPYWSSGVEMHCWRVGASDYSGRWTWWISKMRPEVFIGLPLWMVWAGFLPVAGALWYLDPRRLPGHCPKCGYDLTGNTTGRCPECGRPARS